MRFREGGQAVLDDLQEWFRFFEQLMHVVHQRALDRVFEFGQCGRDGGFHFRRPSLLDPIHFFGEAAFDIAKSNALLRDRLADGDKLRANGFDHGAIAQRILLCQGYVRKSFLQSRQSCLERVFSSSSLLGQLLGQLLQCRSIGVGPFGHIESRKGGQLGGAKVRLLAQSRLTIDRNSAGIAGLADGRSIEARANRKPLHGGMIDD